MNINGETKKWIFMLGVFFLWGCAPAHMKIKVTGDRVQSPIYELSAMNPDWGFYHSPEVYQAPYITTIYDGTFTRCPGPEMVFIMEVKWNDYKLRGKRVEIEGVSPATFEWAALQTIEELSGSLKREPYMNKLISHREIENSPYKMVEAVYKCKQMADVSCQSRDKTIKDVLRKFVVIKKGEWDQNNKVNSLFNTPQMIVLLYMSPVDRFDKGVSEFDRMAQSFKFK
jgi:hypothetical protein